MYGTVRVRSLVWFAAGVVAALVVTATLTKAWRVDAAPGDIDTTFVPITPCRLLDTRDSGEVALGPDESRRLEAHGSNRDCTIPPTAVALSTNVTSVNPTAPTFLTLWSRGQRPTTSSMNPSPGEPPTPNGVIVELTESGRFRVFNLQGNVHVIIDVVGYYISSSLTELADRVAALELAQPFTVAAPTGGGATVGTTPTSLKDVTVTAPVDGTITVSATGYFFDGDTGQSVSCGIMDSISEPFAGVAALWESPTGGDFAHFAVTRAFDVSAGQTKTLRLICLNKSVATSNVNSPIMMAIFTPDRPI